MLATTAPKADTSDKVDRIGITASLLCAVHCLAAPILLFMLPEFASWYANPLIHVFGALLVVPLALFGLGFSYRRHKIKSPLLIGILGCAIILFALLPFWTEIAPVTYSWGDPNTSMETLLACCHHIEWSANGGIISLSWPTLLTIFGSVFLVIGHYLNSCSRTKKKAAVDCACC